MCTSSVYIVYRHTSIDRFLEGGDCTVFALMQAGGGQAPLPRPGVHVVLRSSGTV